MAQKALWTTMNCLQSFFARFLGFGKCKLCGYYHNLHDTVQDLQAFV